MKNLCRHLIKNMSVILVSLVSEQTIPNYLVAKNTENINHHLFFTTSKVLPQYSWLKYAITKHLKHQILNPLQIESDDYLLNLSILESSYLKQSLVSYSKIFFNITGGTKIMVLSIIDYLKKHFNDKLHIVYFPIGSEKIIQIFPVINYTFLKSQIKSTNEYLNVIGFVNKNSESMDDIQSFKFYEKTETKNILDEKTSKKLLDLYLQLKNKDEWRNVLKNLGYNENDEGAFLESYIFHKIKNELKLKDEQICLNLKIYFNKKFSNDYEFDIVFVYNNVMYIVETKINLKNIYSITNRYSGIKNIFGISSKAIIFTLKKYRNNEHKNYTDRLTMLGIIGIYDLKDLKNMFEGKCGIKKFFNIK